MVVKHWINLVRSEQTISEYYRFWFGNPEDSYTYCPCRVFAVVRFLRISVIVTDEFYSKIRESACLYSNSQNVIVVNAPNIFSRNILVYMQLLYSLH